MTYTPTTRIERVGFTLVFRLAYPIVRARNRVTILRNLGGGSAPRGVAFVVGLWTNGQAQWLAGLRRCRPTYAELCAEIHANGERENRLRAYESISAIARPANPNLN